MCVKKGYVLIEHITTPTDVWARDGCEARPASTTSASIDRSST